MWRWKWAGRHLYGSGHFNYYGDSLFRAAIGDYPQGASRELADRHRSSYKRASRELDDAQ